MLGYKLLYLASLVTFTFGALTFSVLTLLYWGRRGTAHEGGRRGIFSFFTVVCASAFLTNLLLQIITTHNPDFLWTTALATALQLVTGLLPPLIFHIIYQEEAAHLPFRRLWLWVLPALYAVSTLVALIHGFDGAGLLAVGWLETVDELPVLVLATAGFLGLVVLSLSRRSLSGADRRHRHWIRILLLLALVVALVDWLQPGPWVALLPDYLVLGFFCVTLYYLERPIFFDLLIKKGAFFALSLVSLTLFFGFGARFFDNMETDWSRPWIFALALTPFWLAGPWTYRIIETVIDRVWLRRRYSAADAERRFVEAVQPSLTEEDLRSRAALSLGDIFQTDAEVLFGDEAASHRGAASAELERDGVRLGMLILGPRPGSIPYMSDDRRLLQSLARTLGVVLENVRFREQRRLQEGLEQELRLLASRAELRALRAQINPHFLFNALNAIAGLIQNRPQVADEAIEQLALVFRYTLRAAEKEWVRLDEELEFAASYLRIEQIRFGRRLQVEFDIDPAAAAIPIPAMSIQPLVENAIRHGISAMQDGGLVRLRAQVNHETLCIEVQDNGPGFPRGFCLPQVAEGNPLAGYGLRNVVERLRGYFGSAAGLQWTSEPGNTRVVLTVPQTAAAAKGASSNDACSDRR